MGNDDIGAESDKFLGVLLGTIASRVGIAKLDLDVFTVRVAEGVQTAPECIGERMRRRRGHHHSNKGEFSWSLCARTKRPRRSHSAEQRNELPSPHGHSLHAKITHLTSLRSKRDEYLASVKMVVGPRNHICPIRPPTPETNPATWRRIGSCSTGSLRPSAPTTLKCVTLMDHALRRIERRLSTRPAPPGASRECRKRGMKSGSRRAG